MIFFFFKQKTAYEMRISDWSSDVCSSDLRAVPGCTRPGPRTRAHAPAVREPPDDRHPGPARASANRRDRKSAFRSRRTGADAPPLPPQAANRRSEEHTSELKSPMRISYAVFCLNKKNQTRHTTYNTQTKQ